MYKVFIDNRAYIFIWDKNIQPNLKVDLRLDAFWGFIDEKQIKTVNKPVIVVQCPDFQSFERVFLSCYDIIPAAGGLVTCRDRILFIRRNGRWDLPKGWIEQEETTEEAAIREVFEETGVAALSINRFLIRTHHTYMEEGRKMLKQTDWFHMNTENPEHLVPQFEEGISEVRWFRSDELHLTRKDTFASIHEVLDGYLFPLQDR
jgi:8-oxo-dGTP pyrophosphatase MutT (NUDIX family)